MREILFRGKRLDNGEWVEGAFLPENETYPATIFGGVRHSVGDYVDPATIGQYTGLKDKNGKRIFEGDVCRFREWSRGDMCWVGKAHWEHQQFVISGGANKECYTGFTLQMSRFIPEDIEDIGNIHDNPELLEVQE